uniref:Uncharacterized protein n=1 Tax=Cannabis sativa TaxID=3483 RepID=A0A803P0S1_CANSA
MVETQNHTCQPRPSQDPQSPGDEEAASQVNMDSEERDKTNDEEYEENPEGYDAYDDGNYTKLLALRQNAVDHEAELTAQKEQNKRILLRESTSLQDREERKSISVHQEPEERVRKSRKHPPTDLRQKLNDKHGDLRKHLEKKKQAIPMSEGALNEGIFVELAILNKDIARVSRRQKGDDSKSNCEDRKSCARNILEVRYKHGGIASKFWSKRSCKGSQRSRTKASGEERYQSLGASRRVRDEYWRKVPPRRMPINRHPDYPWINGRVAMISKGPHVGGTTRNGLKRYAGALKHDNEMIRKSQLPSRRPKLMDQPITFRGRCRADAAFRIMTPWSLRL